MKRISVLAGKSEAHTLGGVLHTATVMGYNGGLKPTTKMRDERGHTNK